MDDCGGLGRLGLTTNLGPLVFEKTHVGQNRLVVFADNRGPDNVPASNLAVILDQLSKPSPFLGGFNLPRDAEVVDSRHEHQQSPWKTDVGCDASAFRSNRLLGDLDENLLPFGEQLIDRVVLGLGADDLSLRLGHLLLFHGLEGVELLLQHVGDVQEGVAL